MTGEEDLRKETIGERLRRLRLEQGASQRDLSAPGITYAYISRIEAGARTPSVKALRMLAKKLGVTPEYLETGSELGSVHVSLAIIARSGAGTGEPRVGEGVSLPRRGNQQQPKLVRALSFVESHIAARQRVPPP